MNRLPLFPLNTVLFPTMPLHLYIFEERYKRMINWCLEEERPFGVVLIKDGVEALGPLAEPYSVGSSARIVRHQVLEDGQIMLTAVGEERFRILHLDQQSAPYLIGDVELMPFRVHDPQAVPDQIQRLESRLNQYLELLSSLKVDVLEIPKDPSEMAYLAAIALIIPNTKKQVLLEIEWLTVLLDELYKLYRQEVPLMAAQMQKKDVDGVESFSVN